MTCHPLPGGGIVCMPSAINQTVLVNGKTVYFDFSRHSGPLLTDKDGEPLKRQPMSPNHPFWGPFNKWLEAWLAEHPEAAMMEPPSSKWDRRP